MGKVMLEGYECERCGHTWIPRATTEETPTICPKCKSPYWNKPRKTNLSREILGGRLKHMRQQRLKSSIKGEKFE